MESVPKSLRLQIGVFGRTNAGKSSFVNMIASQDVSIVSPHPGTTTDAVEKAMELRPAGPVVLIDTAGLDDDSGLSPERTGRTNAVMGRADVFVALTEAGQWGECEARLAEAARAREAPLIVVVNKTDLGGMTDDFRERLRGVTPYIMECSSVDTSAREAAVSAFGELLGRCVSGESAQQKSIIRDLLPPGGLALLVVPIDAGAPKGRLIMPQVQTIRDVLDGGGVVMIVKDSEYSAALTTLNKRPDIVVCDSQVIKQVAAETPAGVRLTTFSVLFARFKGDLDALARGAAAINSLKKGDRVLIAEACTHHAACDDIGRVKIPRMLRAHTGLGDDLAIDTCGGRDYPGDLGRYSLIIHCGACMLTRREMTARIEAAVNKSVPVTNYGMAISYFQGVLDRVIEPFSISKE